jgi:hypothetical protein
MGGMPLMAAAGWQVARDVPRPQEGLMQGA